MTPQQMKAAASEVERRWPTAVLDGFYGNMTVQLDVVVDDKIVGYVDCRNGSVHELSTSRAPFGRPYFVPF